jgi:hypothetical protein
MQHEGGLMVASTIFRGEQFCTAVRIMNLSDQDREIKIGRILGKATPVEVDSHLADIRQMGGSCNLVTVDNASGDIVRSDFTATMQNTTVNGPHNSPENDGWTQKNAAFVCDVSQNNTVFVCSNLQDSAVDDQQNSFVNEDSKQNSPVSGSNILQNSSVGKNSSASVIPEYLRCAAETFGNTLPEEQK